MLGNFTKKKDVIIIYIHIPLALSSIYRIYASARVLGILLRVVLDVVLRAFSPDRQAESRVEEKFILPTIDNDKPTT